MEVNISANFDLIKEFDVLYNDIEKTLAKTGKDMRKRIIHFLQKHGKRATGDLIDSIEEEVKQSVFGVFLEVGPNDDAPHAIFVEEDTRPHWAPIAPLKKWARQKFGAVGKEKNMIAYAVQAKIAKEGTKGIHFMDETFDFYLPLIDARINKAIQKHL